MKIQDILLLISLFIPFLLTGCGSSTASRKEKEKDKESQTIKEAEQPPEKFDMSPYHNTFNFEIPVRDQKEYDIWYGYDSLSGNDNNIEYTEVPGYRVEVFLTDNLEEANTMKSDVFFRTKQDAYIIFDPPYYRVRVGDYENRASADRLSFKLKQLGFQDSRVVSDTIKIAGEK
jgi:hypothetical protein